MSLNLIFRSPTGVRVSFPVQTPTEISLAIHAAKDAAPRLAILERWLSHNRWDAGQIESVLNEARFHMEDPRLVLEVV